MSTDKLSHLTEQERGNAESAKSDAANPLLTTFQRKYAAHLVSLSEQLSSARGEIAARDAKINETGRLYSELLAADIKRARDISRLTEQRDSALEELAELRRLGSAGQGEPPKHKFRPTNGNIYRCAICGSCQCDGTAPAEKEG